MAQMDIDPFISGNITIIRIGEGPIEIELRIDFGNDETRYLYFDYNEVVNIYEEFVKKRSEDLELVDFE